MVERLSRAIMLLMAGVLTSWAANGFAVSVSYHKSDQSNWGYWRGSIVLHKIASNQVTSRDTIYSKSNGYAYYPVIILEGSKVAFSCRVLGT